MPWCSRYNVSRDFEEFCSCKLARLLFVGCYAFSRCVLLTINSDGCKSCENRLMGSASALLRFNRRTRPLPQLTEFMQSSDGISFEGYWGREHFYLWRMFRHLSLTCPYQF